MDRGNFFAVKISYHGCYHGLGSDASRFLQTLPDAETALYPLLCCVFWTSSDFPRRESGARKKTRTSMRLLSLAPEASASTNSAIRARTGWVK